ncbi:hypothetical protein TRFO_13382 [Tritrichomonas foetus]|uniref:Uncharacterized protein n=1 Tax=Tritrichomonas foetus TaxID=1144522 RepID=A0A1J4KY85_9EUKA|nr:hypothetical protein TRFO_13382 [Tritrichomonas foetus]|eukprot:OHT16217.1 hypothetical protein TRFO_13382 [Tritrichomonas foetus]
MSSFLTVLKEIFSFGLSAGSLFGEVLNLIRIFQRVSATRSFKMKFSGDTIELFTWATNLIKMVVNKYLPQERLSDFELFSVYSFGFVLFELAFICTLTIGVILIFFLFPIQIVCALFGVGLGYIGINKKNSLIYGIIGGILFFVFVFPLYCFVNRNTFEEGPSKITRIQIFGATCYSPVVFYAVLFPIITLKPTIGQFVTFFFAAIGGLSFILNFVAICVGEFKVITYLIILITCVNSLLLVPGCESFITVIESPIGPRWPIIAFFSVFGILFPIIVSYVQIKSKRIADKYRSRTLNYFEVADTMHKVIYAIVAAYDYPWVCLGIECAWLIAVLILRPFSGVGDNVLMAGEAIVMIISNLVTGIYDKNGKLFSFAVCVTLLVLACLPVVIAAYCFFIFDIGGEKDEDIPSEDLKKGTHLYKFFSFITIPIAYLLYGANAPFIYQRLYAKM